MRFDLGWHVFDVVTLTREWCPICVRQRMHEIYLDKKFCIGCGYTTEIEQENKTEALQIVRFEDTLVEAKL